MKNSIILYFIFGMVLISSCTKVVVIELSDPEEHLVVEGLISDSLEPYSVRLTSVAPYFSESNPAVTNAQVYISDDMGNLDTLFHNGDGNYKTNGNRQAMTGHRYYLKVIYNNEAYEANSQVPDFKMILDSISYHYHQQSTFFDEGYNIRLYAQENPVEGDFVRFQFYKNGELQTDPFKYFISDDIYVNGNYIIATVPYNYLAGDTAGIEIQSIDRNYYQYLYTISLQVQNTGGPFDSAPANPPTNLTNGALGYFAAVTKSTGEVIIVP